MTLQGNLSELDSLLEDLYSTQQIPVKSKCLICFLTTIQQGYVMLIATERYDEEKPTCNPRFLLG